MPAASALTRVATIAAVPRIIGAAAALVVLVVTPEKQNELVFDPDLSLAMELEILEELELLAQFDAVEDFDVLSQIQPSEWGDSQSDTSEEVTFQ